jgi:uncharacterized membrane protein (UPF0182 family)
LKKVVLAAGNRIVYADDLPQAIAQLAQPEVGTGGVAAAAPAAPAVVAPPAAAKAEIPANVLESIQKHLENYQKLTAAGQLAQAGQELEAIRKETQDALSRSRPPKSPPEQPKRQRQPR